MRKLIVGAFVSIDGVMQAPGGPSEDTSGGFAHGGWNPPHFDDALGEAMGQIFGVPYDLLIGRKTYEIFASYWPQFEDSDEMAKTFGDVNKYVATSDAAYPATWRNSHVVSGDVMSGIRALKAEDGRMLLTQGSTVLLKTLFAADLVDELFLMTFPIVLGAGKRLFDDGSAAGGWTLDNTLTTPKGVIVSRYTRAGAVETGSF